MASTRPWFFRLLCVFYAPVLVSALINVETFCEDTDAVNQVSIFAAYLTLFVFIGFPVQISFDLFADSRKLLAQDLKANYPVLLHEVLAHKRSSVLYYPLFFLRQLIMVCAVVLMRG